MSQKTIKINREEILDDSHWIKFDGVENLPHEFGLFMFWYPGNYFRLVIKREEEISDAYDGFVFEPIGDDKPDFYMDLDFIHPPKKGEL